LQQHLGKALPGAARDVVASELASELVEVAANFVAAFLEDEREGFFVRCGFGDFGGGGANDVDELAVFELVEAVLALFAVLDESGLLQLREVGGDAALAKSEDLLEFGDGELFPVQKEQNPKAVHISDGA
jgi:hypothetical protein